MVAGGIVLQDESVLLVQNLRRNGTLDWSPPGGVIEVAEGESLLDGLTREVREETGLLVTSWGGPLYEVVAEAPGLGWRLRAEVHVALAFEGALCVADPDGIVVDARFVSLADCEAQLGGCHPWVREPLTEWLDQRWEAESPPRPFGYRVDGDRVAEAQVTRLAR